MTIKYSFGAIAHHNDQPPFETPAAVWERARTVTTDMTVQDLFDWASQQRGLLKITITVEARDDDT